MNVTFYATTSSKLSGLPIVNGQLIYLEDEEASYYDMANSRHPLSGVRVVSQLPATGQSNVIYAVVNQAGHADASIWDSASSSYKPLSGYIATSSSLGLVQPDGTTITIDGNGVISCHAEVTSLPADSITYVNSVSELVATNAQDAIDETVGIARQALSTANTASANASTAIALANSAISTAGTALDTANAATSLATQAIDEVAAATTAIAAMDEVISALTLRIQALEAVAERALITEDPVEEP